MGKKVDSDLVRVHLKEGDGALCTSGATLERWPYSDDPKNVTCPNCLRVHIRVLNGRMEALKEVQKVVHWRGRTGTTMCGKEGTMTDYLKSTTCPECLLAHIEEIKKIGPETHQRAAKAEDELRVTKQRCERLMDLVDGSTQRLADAVGREEDARAALRAVAKLV